MKIDRKFIWGLITGIFCFLFIYYLIPNQDCDTHSKIIKILSRQAARWSIAAEQDKSPLIAVMHANYGAGYLWAMKDIATASQVKHATGINLAKLTDEIVKIQDNATGKMAQLCPAYALKNTYLSGIGGESQ